MDDMPDAPSPLELLKARNTLKKVLPEIKEGDLEELSAMTYHMAEGYVFGVACRPEIVPPLEWMPAVLGELMDNIPEDETNEIIWSLNTLYNHIADCILAENRVFEAHTVSFLDPPEKNAEPYASGFQWSLGFSLVHMETDKQWESMLDDNDEEDQKLNEGSSMLGIILGYLATKDEMDELLLKEKVDSEDSPEDFINFVVREFDNTLQAYVSISSMFWD